MHITKKTARFVLPEVSSKSKVLRLTDIWREKEQNMKQFKEKYAAKTQEPSVPVVRGISKFSEVEQAAIQDVAKKRANFTNLRKLALRLIKSQGAASVPTHIREELHTTGVLLTEFKKARPDLYDYTEVAAGSISIE